MQTWLSQLSQKQSTLQHRQVIWLAGDHHWAWQLINPWLSQFSHNIYVGQAELKHAFLTCVKASKPSTLLGYDSDNVVFDAHHGLFPDALTAIAGTIQPGGFLFLLTPNLDDYPSFADEFAIGRTSLGYENQCNNQHTIERLISSAKQHGVIILEQNKPSEFSSKLESHSKLIGKNTPINTKKEQQSVYKSILSNYQSTPESKHLDVITADRGRGKSHLLGLLADSFINSSKDNGINYYLCAPNRAATSSVYKHLSEQVKQKLQFIAPERLSDVAQPNDIILVDEAASISVSTLIEWSLYFKHLIFATTTHGYEGTGKGFQIRFFQHLNCEPSIKWRHHTLTQPIRYGANDPLEAWLFDAFCLDSEPSALALPKDTMTDTLDALEIQYLDKQSLIDSPALLKQVFALLVQAHYQTKPSDLRDLLDAPSLKLFAQITQTPPQHVLGVCLINDEGPIANTQSANGPLHQDIFNGYRRPKGHLMPQVLAHHMGEINALNLKGARIVRIATLENFQRKELGSQLLTAVKEYCSAEHYDYLGSSFADTQDVRHFWFKNEFRLVRQGNKLDKASGTQSAMVIYGLSQNGLKLETNAMAFFNRQDVNVTSADELKSNEQGLLQAFIEHNGSYESAKMILRRFKNFNIHFPKKASKEFKQEVFNWLNDEATD